MNIVDSVVAAWEKVNPQPQPPNISERWTNQHNALWKKLQRQHPKTDAQAIRDWLHSMLRSEPDPNDSAYREAFRQWQQQRTNAQFMAMLTFVDAETDRDLFLRVLSDPIESQRLYWTLLEHSQFSFVTVWRVIERDGYLYKGQPFKQVYTARQGNVAQFERSESALTAAKSMLISHGSVDSITRFNGLYPEQQAEWIAALFVHSWRNHFAHEDARKEAAK